ncbi:MAG: leucine-rich repeat domain-containing protein [Clostridia bacterium]|nr:leucine-rich repeat domain-containing protein [Clostridia bacterium]
MKKLLSAVLVLVMLFTLIPLGAVTSLAETLSGTTGDCTWTLVDGVLTISGNGEMGEHCDNGWWYTFPWEDYQREITKIIIEEGVTRITKSAFWGCRNLEEVSIAESVKKIEEKAFSTCGDNKIELVLSKNISYVDFSAFYNTNFCVTVSNDNPYYKSIGWAVFNSNMTEILYFNYPGYCKQYKIPNGITKIGDYAFANENTDFGMVVIPESVTDIGNYAFYGICVNEVVLPESVITIGERAFAESTIREITLGSMVKKIGTGAFDATESLVIHYNGTVEARDMIENSGAFIGQGQTWHYFGDNNGAVCIECGLERSSLGETLFKRIDNYWYHCIDRVRTYETTLFKYKGKWFYVENGIWQTKATTLVKYKGKWFGVVNGKWNSSTNTLIKYKGKWFYIKNGKWDSSIETLTKYKGKWFYIKNGKWDSSVTKFFKYKGKTFYIKNGKWDSSIITLIEYKGKTRYVKNGKWNKSKAIVRYKPEYVEIMDGVYIAASELKGYKGEQYYVNNGYVQSNFSGKVKVDGMYYNINNGKVV